MTRVIIEGKPDEVAAVAEALHLVLTITTESRDYENTRPRNSNVRRYLRTEGVPYLPEKKD
jgi:hypothetical protein